MAVAHELQTLRELYAVVDRAVQELERVALELDQALAVELWTGPKAEEVREAWQGQRPALTPALTDLLRTSAGDIRVQHNNLAAATGEPDRL